MSDLAAFLLARIAEDEAAAREKPADHFYVMPDGSAFEAVDIGPGWVLAARPDRVLAECEAKRRIVETMQAYYNADETVKWFIAEGLVQYLALPFADHPDYRDEWKP